MNRNQKVENHCFFRRCSEEFESDADVFHDFRSKKFPIPRTRTNPNIEFPFPSATSEYLKLNDKEWKNSIIVKTACRPNRTPLRYVPGVVHWTRRTELTSATTKFLAHHVTSCPKFGKQKYSSHDAVHSAIAALRSPLGKNFSSSYFFQPLTGQFQWIGLFCRP